MNTEEDELEQIYEIIYYYSPHMLYREVYHELVDQSRENGMWDENVGVFDKWLWKYEFYTVEQFIDSFDSNSDSDSGDSESELDDSAWEPSESEWESDEY